MKCDQCDEHMSDCECTYNKPKHEWPLELIQVGRKSTVHLLNIQPNTALYGYPPDSGNWSMEVKYEDGKYISKHHYAHLNGKEWLPYNGED